MHESVANILVLIVQKVEILGLLSFFGEILFITPLLIP